MPTIHPTAWVAPGATVRGDVTLGCDGGGLLGRRARLERRAQCFGLGGGRGLSPGGHDRLGSGLEVGELGARRLSCSLAFGQRPGLVLGREGRIEPGVDRGVLSREGVDAVVRSLDRSAAPPEIRQTSVDVPPMSKAIASEKPASSAILAAPTTPPAGPDSKAQEA